MPRRPVADLEQFGDLMMPDEAVEPILARPVRLALLEWLTELNAVEALAEVGLAPRKKAIFDGPPGVGKTTLAHHLAARLGLPMLAVRPDMVVSKYMGETAQTLGALFQSAAAGWNGEPIMLFLDEFDALSPQRTRATSSAAEDRNQQVNTLLQRLEQFQGFLIAATNYGEHVDQAVWRRFQMHVTLELPGQEERRRIVSRYLAPFGVRADELEALASALEGASPDLIRKLCEGIKRQIVMAPLLKLDMGKAAAFERVLATTHPHKDLGKPRLWSAGASDAAVKGLAWPLRRASDIPADEPAETAADVVVPFSGARRHD